MNIMLNTRKETVIEGPTLNQFSVQNPCEGQHQ
jgi:hypothetical protein